MTCDERLVNNLQNIKQTDHPHPTSRRRRACWVTRARGRFRILLGHGVCKRTLVSCLLSQISLYIYPFSYFLSLSPLPISLCNFLSLCIFMYVCMVVTFCPCVYLLLCVWLCLSVHVYIYDCVYGLCLSVMCIFMHVV